METNWLNIVDTVVKIICGSIITVASGYLVLIQNQKHDNEKEKRERFYMLQEEKKKIYIDFLSLSQSMVQSYLYTSCTGDIDAYKDYLHSFNKVQVISPDEIRIQAHNLLSSVIDFCFVSKSINEPELYKELRDNVNKNVGLLQKVVQVEVSKVYQKA